MKDVILDTNFILTCVKQKIDFFYEINALGLKIKIPEQVIDELKKISGGERGFEHKKNTKISLDIISKNKNKFKTINLRTRNVDKGIKKYVVKNPDILVATLDRELKRKIKNRKIIIRGVKKLEIL